MIRYGAYQADPPDGDITWFTTDRLEAGAYVRGHGSTPNVYVADSVAALILRVSPNITAMEQSAQDELAPADADDATRTDMAGKLTDELIERLSNENDPIWVVDPHWVRHLRPVGD